MPDYQEIFDQRGQLYHQAMETWPEARAEEFKSVIAQADISTGMTVVDVPSGGAYLADHLPPVNLVSLETSSAFAQLAKARTSAALLFEDNTFPLGDSSVDRAISIAGLHHVENKQGFFSEVRRVLRHQGRCVIADVAEDSPVRHFLDEFVGAYTDTGHSGWYFTDNTREELEACGLDIVGDTLLRYQWQAAGAQQLADFCRTLFGMVRTDTANVLGGIRDFLPYSESGGVASLGWELRCFSCEPSRVR